MKKTTYTLDDIEKKVDELALKINAPRDLLPTYGNVIGGKPCIEFDNSSYIFTVISEHGVEYERKKTDKIDDLLYWIFSDVTCFMSLDYELEYRIESKDYRRMLFDKQVELLGQLNETWSERKQAEHQRILKSRPFDDFARLRARFCKQLKQQGYSEKEIKK